MVDEHEIAAVARCVTNAVPDVVVLDESVALAFLVTFGCAVVVVCPLSVATALLVTVTWAVITERAWIADTPRKVVRPAAVMLDAHASVADALRVTVA